MGLPSIQRCFSFLSFLSLTTSYILATWLLARFNFIRLVVNSRPKILAILFVFKFNSYKFFRLSSPDICFILLLDKFNIFKFLFVWRPSMTSIWFEWRSNTSSLVKNSKFLILEILFFDNITTLSVGIVCKFSISLI